MQTDELTKLFNKTKAQLMRTKDAVFFTSVIFSMKFKWDETCRTAWVDGYTFGWNPKFFLSSTPGQRVFTMAHEACHIAQDHIGRRLGRRMDIWGKAADHNINLMLKARGYEMWDWVLADPRFTGMSTDQIYNILLAENCQHENPMDDLREPASCTEDAGGKAKEKPTPIAYRKHIEDILIRASVQAKMQGEAPEAMPGEVELFLQKLLKPRLPWQQIFRREVGQMIRNGHTWTKPNRRFFPKHYLPAPFSIAPSEMTFYVDISGSVSQEQFRIFVSEITGATKMFNLRKIRIVQFDHRIRHDDTVHSFAELAKIKFTGRGGTWITPVLDDIEKTQPPLAAIFTDGGFGMDREQVKSRILWLINDNPEWSAPFGRVIHFNTEKM